MYVNYVTWRSVSPVESSAGGSTSTGTAGFNESSSTSDREIPLVKTREEEVYCPSSPTPQKSILKDSSDKKQVHYVLIQILLLDSCLFLLFSHLLEVHGFPLK